ncbi:hypothetical protein CEXT_740031 [Caerostris extrusa]|uniref:Uncharacterized protein n=1 Tax=Caerostris extrusa TaxID=172846 RepID=A0AAV4MKU0_CAEEX|nr:hypothetical protein CEXT_740031 [Caerostris extrusa]
MLDLYKNDNVISRSEYYNKISHEYVTSVVVTGNRTQEWFLRDTSNNGMWSGKVIMNFSDEVSINIIGNKNANNIKWKLRVINVWMSPDLILDDSYFIERFYI